MQISPIHHVDHRHPVTDNALLRGVSKTPTISKMDLFVTSVNGCKPLTNATKRCILDVVGVPGTSLLNKIDTRS